MRPDHNLSRNEQAQLNEPPKTQYKNSLKKHLIELQDLDKSSLKSQGLSKVACLAKEAIEKIKSVGEGLEIAEIIAFIDEIFREAPSAS